MVKYGLKRPGTSFLSLLGVVLEPDYTVLEGISFLSNLGMFDNGNDGCLGLAWFIGF